MSTQVMCTNVLFCCIECWLGKTSCSIRIGV